MPNGGSTPDCFHCKLFKRDSSGSYKCEYHQINLAYPIRAFCSNYQGHPNSDDKNWLDEVLDRTILRDDLMYLWVEKQVKVGTAYTSTFFHVPLTTIAEYDSWTEDQFLEFLAEAAQKNQNE
jgi:hypothetical protein